MYNIQIENWDVTNLAPLRRISPSRFGLVSKKVWVVLAEVFLSFPGGFFLHMMTPLNLAKLDDLAAGNPTCSLENLDGLLLIGQITIQLYGLQWHCISQRNIGHLRMALLQLGNVKHIMNS